MMMLGNRAESGSENGKQNPQSSSENTSPISFNEKHFFKSPMATRPCKS